MKNLDTDERPGQPDAPKDWQARDAKRDIGTELLTAVGEMVRIEAVRKGPAAERPGFFRGARVNSKRPATDKG